MGVRESANLVSCVATRIHSECDIRGNLLPKSYVSVGHLSTLLSSLATGDPFFLVFNTNATADCECF